MDASLAPSQELSMLVKHVHDLSMNGDEPPPRYIRKDIEDDAPVNHSISSSIPIIDLHLLSSSSSSSEDKDKELAKLKSALTSWGFFQAVGHGIPDDLLDEVQITAKKFFTLSMEEKNKLSNKIEGKQEFLQGYGNDFEVGEDQLHEWADRLYLLLKAQEQRDYNFWPENPTKFRHIINEYSANVHLVAELILKFMAMSLGLQEDFLISPVKENAPTSLMFNFYPPCSRPDLVYGIKPHTDGGAITVLLQDKEVEGLQVLKDGQWIKVPIVPNALLVNVANQVEIMSNGVFKSAMHRVIPNPEKQRISVAMFYVPENEIILEPVAKLISDAAPRLYRKMTSAEYGEIYFQRTGAALGHLGPKARFPNVAFLSPFFYVTQKKKTITKKTKLITVYLRY